MSNLSRDMLGRKRGNLSLLYNPKKPVIKIKPVYRCYKCGKRISENKTACKEHTGATL